MARSIFFVLVATLCFGCSSPQKADNLLEPMPHSRLDDHVDSLAASQCVSPTNSEYACLDGVSSASDVSEFTGYHVIAFVKDGNGVTFAHVADTCQHYFCAVDMPPPSDTQCKQPKVHTVGCCLASAVKPKDPSNK